MPAKVGQGRVYHWPDKAVETAPDFSEIINSEGSNFNGFHNHIWRRAFPAGRLQIIDDIVQNELIYKPKIERPM